MKSLLKTFERLPARANDPSEGTTTFERELAKIEPQQHQRHTRNRVDAMS
jgi:hypothetical protein